MTPTEIKKELYKKSPVASFVRAYKDGLSYSAFVYNDKDEMQVCLFLIPYSDMGDAEFFAVMEAKYLIRWLLPHVDVNRNIA